MNDKFIVHYFPLNARGAFIRAILSACNANWEDNRITFQDWPTLKSTGKFEFGQLPALEYNGKFYCQSLAIEVFLSNKFGLFGYNSDEQYEITSLVCSREDVYQHIVKVFFPMTDEAKNNLPVAKNNLLTVILPNFLKIFEKRVNSRQGRFIVGNKFSLGDIFLAVFVLNVFLDNGRKAEYGPILTENAPNLEKYVHDLGSNELKDYFTNHYIQGSPF